MMAGRWREWVWEAKSERNTVEVVENCWLQLENALRRTVESTGARPAVENKTGAAIPCLGGLQCFLTQTL